MCLFTYTSYPVVIHDIDRCLDFGLAKSISSIVHSAQLCDSCDKYFMRSRSVQGTCAFFSNRICKGKEIRINGGGSKWKINKMFSICPIMGNLTGATRVKLNRIKVECEQQKRMKKLWTSHTRFPTRALNISIIKKSRNGLEHIPEGPSLTKL